VPDEPPFGTSPTEQQLTAAFGVSRHTVREAFQILVAERLVRTAVRRCGR
jgi:DNA-binding FadR family transcriptional regulator